MIINLFSIFDPSSYFGITINWVVIIIILIYLPTKYYLMNSGFLKIFKNTFIEFRKVFKEVSFPNYLALNFVCVLVLMYLILRNLIRLFPFVFRGCAHPLVTLGIGLVCWLSFFIIGWIKNFKLSAAHLVPEGSPILLAPLIVIIERISHLIRPFTLSIRLAANIMAGHLIIGLISRISILNIYRFYVSVIFQSILILLEFGVAIIQGFVFRILLLLYALEYY